MAAQSTRSPIGYWLAFMIAGCILIIPALALPAGQPNTYPEGTYIPGGSITNTVTWAPSPSKRPAS